MHYASSVTNGAGATCSALECILPIKLLSPIDMSPDLAVAIIGWLCAPC